LINVNFYGFVLSVQEPPLSSPSSSPASTSRWIWILLLCWLVYSFSTLAWYLLNDPAFMGGICKER